MRVYEISDIAIDTDAEFLGAARATKSQSAGRQFLARVITTANEIAEGVPTGSVLLVAGGVAKSPEPFGMFFRALSQAFFAQGKRVRVYVVLGQSELTHGETVGAAFADYRDELDDAEGVELLEDRVILFDDDHGSLSPFAEYDMTDLAYGLDAIPDDFADDTVLALIAGTGFAREDSALCRELPSIGCAAQDELAVTFDYGFSAVSDALRGADKVVLTAFPRSSWHIGAFDTSRCLFVDGERDTGGATKRGSSALAASLAASSISDHYVDSRAANLARVI